MGLPPPFTTRQNEEEVQYQASRMWADEVEDGARSQTWGESAEERRWIQEHGDWTEMVKVKGKL